MEKEQQTWKPTKFYAWMIGVLVNDDYKNIQANKPELIQENNAIFIEHIDTSSILQNANGDLYMLYENDQYFPLKLGKWIQIQCDPFEDNKLIEVEYNAMIEYKGICNLYSIEPENELIAYRAIRYTEEDWNRLKAEMAKRKKELKEFNKSRASITDPAERKAAKLKARELQLRYDEVHEDYNDLKRYLEWSQSAQRELSTIGIED